MPDEWTSAMYACLANYGIRPWEFGDLTFPWLKVILDKGKVQEDEDALEWKVRQARAMTKEFTNKLEGKI